MERFPAFTQVKYTLTGSVPTCGCSIRMMSPSAGSTFTTSAPRSASMRPQIGPETTCERSSTRTPSSGEVAEPEVTVMVVKRYRKICRGADSSKGPR